MGVFDLLAKIVKSGLSTNSLPRIELAFSIFVLTVLLGFKPIFVCSSKSSHAFKKQGHK